MDALEMALLYDYYGGMLTDKQRSCFDMRYNQDLSLGEIAQNLGISRQAVCDSLTRTEALLRKMESQIGCVGRSMASRRAIHSIQEAAGQLQAHPDASVSHLGAQILAAVQELEE